MDLTNCVLIEQSGRSGRISVSVGGKVLPFEWEFGGGTTVAIIPVPSPEQWQAHEPWQSLDRSATLDALGRELCRLKCKSCSYHFDARFLEIRNP